MIGNCNIEMCCLKFYLLSKVTPKFRAEMAGVLSAFNFNLLSARYHGETTTFIKKLINLLVVIPSLQPNSCNVEM